MNEIIKVNKTEIDGDEVNSVNSRDIYEYLEVGRQYADWIKSAIDKYDFEEGSDFTVHNFVNGRATQKDYIVTLDMAKELCMVSNTEKGKETRKYFIKIEKEMNKPKTQAEILAESAQLLLEQERRLSSIENKLEKIDELPALVNKAYEAVSNTQTRETLPLENYHTKKFYASRYGMSEQTVNKLIGAFDPRYCECTKFVETVGISEYKAYKIQDMDSAFKTLMKSADKVTKQRYESKYISGRFQCNAISI